MTNIIDDNFYNLVSELKSLSKEQIHENINKYFSKVPIQTRFELEDYFNSRKEEYDEISNRADILKNHIDDLVYIYDILYDYRSKKVLNGIIKSWYRFEFTELISSNEKNFPEYFELDIIRGSYEDIILDTNVFDGNFIIKYLSIFNECYYKIYGYEKNIDKIYELNEMFDDYKNIIINNDIKDALKQKALIKIDKNIRENLDYLKEYILANKPNLIIKLNTNNDIWHVPILIKSISTDYNICLRIYNSSIYPKNIILTAFAK